jgi:CRP-like cAMP-binding protein
MRRMFEALSESTWRVGHALVDLAFEDIRRRVALTLLDLMEGQGDPGAAGLRIPVKLSQTTLGRMVAASRENVNRALAPLMAQGALSQRDGFFIVHDRRALEALAAAGPTAD